MQNFLNYASTWVFYPGYLMFLPLGVVIGVLNRLFGGSEFDSLVLGAFPITIFLVITLILLCAYWAENSQNK